MHAWQNPPDPDTELPPPDDDEPVGDPNPFERPPFDRDPEAQRAPGAGHEDPDSQQPPMQAAGAPGPIEAADATEQVGNDNIREGRVGGVMGAPHATNGQGQGG